MLGQNFMIPEMKGPKFDISNILDQKKMQKNQEKVIVNTINANYQKIPFPDSLLKK